MSSVQHNLPYHEMSTTNIPEAPPQKLPLINQRKPKTSHHNFDKTLQLPLRYSFCFLPALYCYWCCFSVLNVNFEQSFRNGEVPTIQTLTMLFLIAKYEHIEYTLSFILLIQHQSFSLSCYFSFKKPFFLDIITHKFTLM